jgi:DNA modification methylase
VNPIRQVETGAIYCGDNLERLAQFPDECIDLIYLDPPFFSNRHYEVIWGDEAEVRSFEDRWEGDIYSYIAWMRERVIEMHRVLKPTGSFYLHADHHAGHYLKVMLDDIFRASNLRNEIIWSYKRYTAASNRFQRLHDTIFFYGKGSESVFNDIREPYGPKSGKADAHYKQDDDGRWYRWQKRKDQEPHKLYLDPKGRRLGDVWEIPTINASARERLGYPTQKPELLLERVILASSNPGDTVLDPFAGCGTTQVVAERLGREWIGIDISPTAVGIMERRLLKATNGAAKVKLVNVPMTEVQLRTLKPFEFQNWVMQQVTGTGSPRKSGDMGIDGYSFMYHDPIQVKQSERVGRNVVDNFETAVERSGKDTGFVVAFSFTRGAFEEAARARAAGKPKIVLVTVNELLNASHYLLAPLLSDFRPLPPGEPSPADRIPTPDLIGIFGDVRKNPFDRPLATGARPTDSVDELVASGHASVG